MVNYRNKTIDVAKGLGILFVIFAHINLTEPFLTIIYSFHMPLFFVIAGFNLHPEKFDTFSAFLKKKAKTLLVPYLIFCFIGLAYHLLSRVAYHVSYYEIYDYLKKAFFSIIWAPYSLKYFTIFNTPLWFVPCLFLVESMFFGLSKTTNKSIFWILVTAISAAGWIMEANIIPFDFSLLPWNFSSACFSLSFLALGNCLYPLADRIIFYPELTKSQTIKLLFLFISSAFITVVVGLFNGKVSIGSRILNIAPLFIITGLTGTTVILVVSRFLENSSLLSFFGKNSFTVMGCHYVIFDFVCTVLTALNKHTNGFIPKLDSGNLSEGTVLFLIVAILSGIFTLLYNKCKSRLSDTKLTRT